MNDPGNAYNVKVIGPFGGQYYLAYDTPGKLMYLAVSPFFSKELAEATAYRMNCVRVSAWITEDANGR